MLTEADAGFLFRSPENVINEFPQFPHTTQETSQEEDFEMCDDPEHFLVGHRCEVQLDAVNAAAHDPHWDTLSIDDWHLSNMTKVQRNNAAKNENMKYDASHNRFVPVSFYNQALQFGYELDKLYPTLPKKLVRKAQPPGKK
mgnify:CR=1 FL=1